MPAAAELSSEERVRDGVRNLVQEVAGVQRGEHVLVASEFGRVEQPLAELIGQQIQADGAEPFVLWTLPIPPGEENRPEPLIKTMEAFDKIIYNFPAGAPSERQVSAVSFLDREAGPSRFTNNFVTLEMIGSDYARYSARVINAVYDLFEEIYSDAKTWRITSVAGTDISGRVGKVSSRQAIFEGLRSPFTFTFPVRIHKPVGSYDANGRILVEHCGVPPVKIEHPPLLTIENDRVVAVEGEDVSAYQQALTANAERWGDNANYLDSWHSGLHPKGPNIEGFIGHGCSARMHMHI